VSPRSRKARVEDVHELALRMPHVTVWDEESDRPVYQVGGKSFVFFRNARPDARDPESGERYDDVICVWVPSEADKQAMVQDEDSPWFTTSHFDGHPSVLVRESRHGLPAQGRSPRTSSPGGLDSTGGVGAPTCRDASGGS
jgi:hypothetical protein